MIFKICIIYTIVCVIIRLMQVYKDDKKSILCVTVATLIIIILGVYYK